MAFKRKCIGVGQILVIIVVIYVVVNSFKAVQPVEDADSGPVTTLFVGEPHDGIVRFELTELFELDANVLICNIVRI